MSGKILRLSAVRDSTGLPTSSIYEKISRGEFPNSIPLGAKAVGWLEDEVEAWKKARIAERDAKLATAS
jgi:prophage regulatory protein